MSLVTVTSSCSRKAILLWLVLCAFMVFVMIVIGGVTRLTGSGLSIVEWKPVVGTLPPLSDADWQAEFEKYQAHSEYQKINAGMSLTQFKMIYGLEYFHRLWGRIIGLVFLLPLIIFWYRGHLAPLLKRRLGFFLFLGLAQGLAGWLMVKSGLGDDPHVSPYRLTLHLLLALTLYGGLIWTALQIRSEGQLFSSMPHPLLSRLMVFLLLWACLTLSLGGLVAGHKAGLMYNTFPLMGDQLIPDELWHLSPWWHNLVANPVTVQFLHRIAALLLLAMCLSIYIWGAMSTPHHCWHLGYVALATLAQITLGILTLLYSVPMHLGVLHQAGGVVVLTAVLFSLFHVHPRS